MPSSSSRITSEGTPRIVEVIGATVTVDKYAMALLRVSTTTAFFYPAFYPAKGTDRGGHLPALLWSHAASFSQAAASSRDCGFFA